MIQLSDDLISLAVAARLLPRRRRGKKPHISCLYRWSTTGCRGVVLETIQIGGTRCTSKAALAAFFERLSRVSDYRRGVTAADDRISAPNVEKELDAHGIR
jgi:hypothetical protein